VPLNILPQRLPKGLADGIGRSIGAAGITPNMISVAGFAGNVVAGYLAATDRLIAAGIVFLVFSLLDMVDGAVARATGQATPFGAVFDAVLDRCGEAALLCGIGWYFGERGEQVQAAVIYAGLFGSIAVSYMRARAEVNGLEMREGLFRRQERVALLTIGLLFNGLTVAAWVLAVLANLTALQRFWMIARRLQGQDES
jgi:CDP-diacylglycerol--glycerol-3-phosphate 3-phosphatidyltransferase